MWMLIVRSIGLQQGGSGRQPSLRLGRHACALLRGATAPHRLRDRAADGKVVVVDSWNFEVPSTKEARNSLAKLGAEGRVLIVADIEEVNTWKSFANLPMVHTVSRGELNAYDILVSDWVIFTKETLPSSTQKEEEK